MPARTCEICGERRAVYSCQECGSAVCQLCEKGRLCKACAEKFKGPLGEYDGAFRHQPILFLIGFVIVLAGFLLVFFGFSASFSSGSCFLWPLPLIVACGLGGSNDLYLALGLVLVTTVSVLVFSWWSIRRLRF